MSWSTWGLSAPLEAASERVVIEGGGRVFVLGTDPRRASVAERFGERWSVTRTELSTDAPLLERGDVVIWRGIDDLFGGHVWSGPTRVLSVREVDPSRVEVHTLADARTDEHGPGGYTDWFDEAFATDCLIPPSEEWNVLAYWRLHPLCPRCGATSRAYVYGMPAFGVGDDDDDDTILGGCVVEERSPSHQCSGCGHDFWDD